MPRKANPKPVDSQLFARYRPLPGVPDELADASGAMRPGWAGLMAHLSALSAAETKNAFARGAQHLADTGVFFRKYGDRSGAARDWPFSPVPVILPEAEWRSIEAGLIQRAELLELVAADLYGANRLVAEGHLPASLIAQNPEWLRPMVGVRPRSGHFLHFVAFEIGRGPDGGWWVLSDRTDAPSGAGFALESRVAATRVFPDLYRNTNVLRLAGFFRAFRDALENLRIDPNSRVGILTPGQLTDTYYEQAYIARYLGMALLEGEDLTVENGCLCVRTVAGLAPVDVLWRRMDGIWADPLELREDSRLGTPGLMSAVRQGHVTMVNALGVGVLETQALMAFLPKIAQVLTGQGLRLPNVATWWCGQEGELAHVRAHADRMMIGPALATRMPFESGAAHAIGGQMRGSEAGLHDWLSENAAGLVGKELVTLSTTPVHEAGVLVPRPMTLRAFLARTPEGWQVMPGGFARVGASTDTTAISMHNGGSVADVWIVSDDPVDPVTMLPPPSAPFVRAEPGPLPSSAADNLFWLGRYVERTEGLLRLVRAFNSRLDEAATEPLLAAIRAHLKTYHVDAAEPFPKGLRATLASAVYSANQIRDRCSVDAWAALKDMEKSMARIARTTLAGGDAAMVMSVMLRKIAGFAGLVHENMYRAEGWQFLTIGRSLERAAMISDLLAVVADPKSPEGGLDLAVEVGDSIMVHRQRYAVLTSRESVIDLLALDARNPRALRFHLEVIGKRVHDLRGSEPDTSIQALEAKVSALRGSIAAHSVLTLDTAALIVAQRQTLDLTAALHAAFMH
ncbi:circularly permuted type 2 ATP-grasp protein [Phaeovulum sp.]|uniref:circularly permuted type 2 ATP-grasp protein n=1 Tax=Phaeovulum sp. TaxID=2934796 RepID=UPI00273100B2|nr:circularly permuted type 2 ATP-grasp protein [Phaeovulum sp.]MDP1669682.1 circularly permuted type 2 ATP-grasp protein [Phaeovulum sp.]MDZ4117906.1 circularly permuted type 2 ATP-grasp protein [Phaeovulum sp.]